jgi:hypothetical protein
MLSIFLPPSKSLRDMEKPEDWLKTGKGKNTSSRIEAARFAIKNMGRPPGAKAGGIISRKDRESKTKRSARPRKAVGQAERVT